MFLATVAQSREGGIAYMPVTIKCPVEYTLEFGDSEPIVWLRPITPEEAKKLDDAQ